MHFMWHSEQGDVVIRGAAGELFSDSLWGMVDGFIYSDDTIETGVAVFDRLSGGQQIAAMHLVAPAVLREDVSPPHLTAVSEGALAAVFRHYVVYIDGESHDEQEPRSDARALALAAARERKVLPNWGEDHVSFDDWGRLLDDLSGTYLWDLDYEDGDELADMPPEQSSKIRQKIGILDDYYAWMPDDYVRAEAKAAAKELSNLCRHYDRS